MSRALPDLASHPMLSTPGLVKVFAAIKKAGGEARIVGGAVRNALLGEAVSDIDLATTLVPDAVMQAGLTAKMKVIPTGIDHGTVTLVSAGTPFEVTTLRADVETDGRHASVEFSTDWEADASRRDFTLNALYCDSDGKLYDPLGGYDDLMARQIRFVGDPDARIAEDYLRILRFFRFYAQYAQSAPDNAALAACKAGRDGLKQLSRERVAQEMRKLLQASGAEEAARFMNETGVSDTLFGCKLNSTLLAQVKSCAFAASTHPDYVTLLAASLPVGTDELVERLKLSNADVKALRQIRDTVPPSPQLRDNERKAVLYQTGEEAWRRVVLMAWAQSGGQDNADWLSLYRLPDEWPVPVLPVTGADIVAAGVEPGPQVGEVLRRLEDWWVAGGFEADREQLLERISI